MQLSLEHCLQQYNIIPKGLIHVGINTGQEIPDYQRLGIPNLLCIDATEKFIYELKKKYPNITFVACAISNYNGVIEFNIASNNSESSSIFPLKIHKQVYPDIDMVEKRIVPCQRLDSVVADPEKYNILCMDIQGAELLALEGYESQLSHIDAIFTEFSLVELYEGCVLKPKLESWLNEHGFVIAAFGLEHLTWGDALFIKKELKQ